MRGRLLGRPASRSALLGEEATSSDRRRRRMVPSSEDSRRWCLPLPLTLHPPHSGYSTRCRLASFLGRLVCSHGAGTGAAWCFPAKTASSTSRSCSSWVIASLPSLGKNKPRLHASLIVPVSELLSCVISPSNILTLLVMLNAM